MNLRSAAESDSPMGPTPPEPSDTSVPAAFPFDAVLGHDNAKLALRLAALDPLIGGVLLRGHKGSAKTTLARGLAERLGDAPFVELPLGASEDRVVGSIDTHTALSRGEIQFRPGLLAAANNGVLYVDEINLLPDHLVDVLLDVAVSGHNRVERDGVSHQHPARFVLIGSMNPEEGELRPQLLDRFGFCVTMETSTDLEIRAEAVRRRLAFDAGNLVVHRNLSDKGDPYQVIPEDPEPAVSIPPHASIDDTIVSVANRLAVAVGAEGLRADLTLCRAAAAHARLHGRSETTVDDVAAIVPLVLAHRSRRGPFDPPVLPPEAIEQAWEEATGTDQDDQRDQDGSAPPSPADASSGSVTDSDINPGTDADANPEIDADAGTDAGADAAASASDPPHRHRETGQPLPIGMVRRIADTERRRPVVSTRGAIIGDRAAVPGDPIAIVPTARRIAQSAARGTDDPMISEHARSAVRAAAPRRTVILCVDLSGSMGAAERAEAASGTVLGLLAQSYERRDRVALVTFAGDGATVVLTPTASIEVARQRLGDLHTGGTTPLAQGLQLAGQLARQTQRSGDEVLIAVLTDGRANGDLDAVNQALEQAAAIAAGGFGAIVLDCESGSITLGLAAPLAEAMGAQYLPVDTLHAGAIIDHLRAAS